MNKVLRFLTIFLFLIAILPVVVEIEGVNSFHGKDYNKQRLQNALGSHFSRIHQAKKTDESFEAIDEFEENVKIGQALQQVALFFILIFTYNVLEKVHSSFKRIYFPSLYNRPVFILVRNFRI